MQGVKVRSYNNSTGRIAELSGMVPVQIEAAEISEGLVTGVIDSLITSAVTGQDSKAWEQLSHFYKVNAWQPRNYVIANKDTWTGLDEKTRGAISKCAETAEANGIKMSIAANDAALGGTRQERHEGSRSFGQACRRAAWLWQGHGRHLAGKGGRGRQDHHGQLRKVKA